jgi:DNA-binding transcriptional regulator GbsR (MarR family)
MVEQEKLKEEFIMNFGHAYKSFGLSKLIGHIIALLIFSTKPISLEDISKQLNRSKGPISQLTGRLREKHLIRRVWQPTSRKDFYEIEPEVFENAFRNSIALNRNNTKIAEHFLSEIKTRKIDGLDMLETRLKEMSSFYNLMDKHYKNFLDEWQIERKKIYKNT